MRQCVRSSCFVSRVYPQRSFACPGSLDGEDLCLDFHEQLMICVSPLGLSPRTTRSLDWLSISSFSSSAWQHTQQVHHHNCQTGSHEPIDCFANGRYNHTITTSPPVTASRPISGIQNHSFPFPSFSTSPLPMRDSYPLLTFSGIPSASGRPSFPSSCFTQI